jgi:hypothetical protein
MSTITFPTLDQVKQEIEIHKTVQKIKKLCFMNGCDTNKTFDGVKESIIDNPKVLRKM